MRTTTNHLDIIAADPSVRAIADAMRQGGRELHASGSSGSSTALVAAAIAQLAKLPLLLLVAHLDDADETVDELTAVGVNAVRFPALEFLPGESSVSLELFAERLSLVRRLITGDLAPGSVFVAPVQSLMQAAPAPARLAQLVLTLTAGQSSLGPDAVVRWLDGAGYSRTDSIEEPGDFAVRGGIIDIFPPQGAGLRIGDNESAAVEGPVRLDFFGDDLESVTEIDLETLGSERKLKAVELIGAQSDALLTDDGVNVIELIPTSPGFLAVIAETLEVTEQARGYYERVTDARGVFGPPAVLKALRERAHSTIEINSATSGMTFGKGAETAPPPSGRELGGGTSSSTPTTFHLPAHPLPEFARETNDAVAELAVMSRERRVMVLCQNEGEQHRLTELLNEFAKGAPIVPGVAYLHRGFLWGDAESTNPLALVPYHELLHRYNTRRRIRRLRGAKSTDTFLDLTVGDVVVHADHGIALFTGLETMKPRRPRDTAAEAEEKLAKLEKLKLPPGKKANALRRAQALTTGDSAQAATPKQLDSVLEEYLTLEFAGRAKLHIPVSQIEKVQRYIGGFKGKPPLSTLGGKKWQSQKAQVKESVQDLAAELLRVQAAREHSPGIRYPSDTPWQHEFEEEFPYEETEDQLAALVEIKKDMTSPRPMDRLLCGDVGYGKTELAIRAAFKAAEYGKQVAVLVPTTILAEQHERTFRSRFADYPFKVASLSRFKTTQEQRDIIENVRRGRVDILIGTHRILSKDVRFADLGLVVIDEEQRFGVEHKQALLALRLTADILTLSATPIPRTLHMSMLGLRDISSLSTPPLDRRAVVTEVMPYNEKRVKAAMERELARDGQIYFVHNRIHDIQSVADDVQKLVPNARIVIGHGQMPDGELEEVMHTFMSRKADILVSTTIIESGIDIPTANTMFIHGADRFGLADLHQLRGRVGRYKHRAYCYLLLPEDRPVTDIARRRLRAIEEFSMLGAGFKIAMQDLEIRGAGNLLGAEQSGHIAAVGYDMYCRLLEQAARELRHERTTDTADTSIEIGVVASIPHAYIPSTQRRLDAYRRIAQAHSADDLASIERALTEAYGPPPRGCARLIELAALRIGAADLGVRSIAVHEHDVVFRTERVNDLLAAMHGASGTLRPLTPKPGDPLTQVYYRPPANFLEPDTLLTVLRKRLGAGVIHNPVQVST